MAIEFVQPTLFESLVEETHELLSLKDRLEEQYIHVVVKIGQNLIKMRPHKQGEFISWVQSEFHISRFTANNYIHVAEVYGDDVERVLHLPLRVVYELAAPSTPDEIREAVEDGQIPATISDIREAKQQVIPPVTHVPLYDPDQAGPKGYEFWKAEPVTEETRYQDAVDNGTLDYYYADLRRTAIQNDREMREIESPIKSATLTVLQSSESNEWFTPAVYVDAARELMGGIDVDPASCEFANRTVQATTYYDITTNGLEREWRGRVWLNPPYGRDGGDSNQEIWSRRLIEQYDAGIVTEAVLLVNAVPGNKWFQPLWRFLLCFPDHRIRFYNQETDASQPTHSNALVYLGDQHGRFDALFSQFGVVVKRFRS